MPTAQEWLSDYADKLGVPMPSAEEIDAILALAGVAAHASERIAAPVACWMAAGSDVSLADARRLADELAD
jgi:sulfite reductase beta subunit-like hemoprotein